MSAFASRKSFADAQQANLAFVISTTTHLEAEVYEIEYPEVDYASKVPVDFSAHPWAKTVTYRSSDKYGRADWVAGKADDIPFATVSREQFEVPIHMAGIGYEYGLEEVEQARMQNIPLEADNIRAAVRAYEEFMYDLTFSGDATKGLQGLFSYSGVPSETIPADGTGSSALWSTKTASLIVRDVNAMLTGMRTATQYTILADTLILPEERYDYIGHQFLDGTGAVSILDYIKQHNVYTNRTGRDLMIVPMRGLLTAGSGSTARMIAYRRTPETLKLHVPLPHMFLPLQFWSMTYQRPGVFRTAGLDIRLPLGVRYGDGI